MLARPSQGAQSPAAPRPRRLSAWLPALLYMGLIFGLSSLSNPPVPEVPLQGSDKVLHVILYTGLGSTLAWALSDAGRRRGWKTMFATTLLALLYGGTDEVHQRFVPGRFFEVGDMVADMVGGFLGAAAVSAGIAIRDRRRRKALGHLA